MKININHLKFSYEDPWLEGWAKKNSQRIVDHPLYQALKGNVEPLRQWCFARKDIYVDDRLGLLFDVYKSLVKYGQLEPIVISKDHLIVTGHKRCCCLMAMGVTEVDARMVEDYKL